MLLSLCYSRCFWGTMVKICSVRYCYDVGGHRIPNDSIKITEGLAAIGRKIWSLKAASVVCKVHFKDTDYCGSGSWNWQHQRLKSSSAVHSVFLQPSFSFISFSRILIFKLEPLRKFCLQLQLLQIVSLLMGSKRRRKSLKPQNLWLLELS